MSREETDMKQYDEDNDDSDDGGDGSDGEVVKLMIMKRRNKRI